MKKVTKIATTTTPATPAPTPVKKVAAAKPAKETPAKPKIAQSAAPVAPAIKVEKPVFVAFTTIVAQIDVGFGNTLYVRGEGPGLSWETGVPLDCVADDKWSLSLQGAKRPIVFKFLVNDITWSDGEDYIAQPGSSVVLTPSF